MRYEDKYLNRIVSQHKIRPKYMAWLKALLDKIQDVIDLVQQLDTAFDVETAVGVQLDMIGHEVGVSRLLNFEPVYAPALLPDEYYRLILKAKISLNQWDGTTDGIRSLWGEIFDGYTMDVVDHQDMSMTLKIYGLNSLFESEFISHSYLAPKPEGVRVNYEFVLEVQLQTQIYSGAAVVNTRTEFSLKPKSAFDGLELDSDAFVGGVIAAFTSFTLPSAALIGRS